MGYLEREAVLVRRGHDGVERLGGTGLLGAAFRHRVSRAGDPQLHTHVVVANATRGCDGEWSALDARHLYAHARTAGHLYQAQLRTGLHTRLGLHWLPAYKGGADLDGVPVEALLAFSQRRVEIEAALNPDATANDARRVTLATRRAKDNTIDAATLHEQWAARALSLGVTRESLNALCRPAHERGITARPSARVADPALHTGSPSA